MIKERLLSLMGDMKGPSEFSDYRELLQAKILKFPEHATIPKKPDVVYGQGWDRNFLLPHTLVGIEDAESLVIFKDTKPKATGLEVERLFLFIQPLPCPPLPVDFYIAWGICYFTFTSKPLRMNAHIAKEGEWFVGEKDSEFSDGQQMTMATRKCESLIFPGVTTAIEQLAYLKFNM